MGADRFRFDQLLAKRIRKAHVAGIRHPVIAFLGSDNLTAWAMYADLHGRKLRPRGSNYLEGWFMDTWSVQDATHLLRGHGGIGGAATANLLESPPRQPDLWLLRVENESLSIGGFGEGGPEAVVLFESSAFYDRLPFALCANCKRRAERTNVLPVPVSQGLRTVVCGTTMANASRAADLIKIVDARHLHVPRRNEATVDLPLRSDDLGLILHEMYLRRPEAVAEAIRGLRKLPGKQDAWLTEVLEGDSRLRKLARKVRRLIVGEK